MIVLVWYWFLVFMDSRSRVCGTGMSVVREVDWVFCGFICELGIFHWISVSRRGLWYGAEV